MFNFTLDHEVYASNQSIVATYEHVGFRAYCTLLFAVKQQQKIESSTKSNFGFQWVLNSLFAFTSVTSASSAHLSQEGL